MRRSILILLLVVFLTPHGKAQTFWDTLGQLLRAGCTYTQTFSFGSNWDWICSLQSIYRNISWMIQNIGDYAQSLVFESFTGVLEGTMQSLGIAIGPGVNNFVSEIEDAVRTVRQGPTKLRSAIAKAMVEDAKQKYLNNAANYPPGSGQASLASKEDASPTVVLGKINSFLKEVKKGLTVGGLTTAIAEGNEKFKESKEAVDNTVQLAAKVFTPKEAEQVTGGVVQRGIADQLIDKAKTAASTREVMETTVEAIATLLKLQAVTNVALSQQLNQQLQAQLLSNQGLTALYDQISEQVAREAGDAEAALQTAALALDDVIRDMEQELNGLAEVVQSLSDFARNVPDLGRYVQ